MSFKCHVVSEPNARSWLSIPQGYSVESHLIFNFELDLLTRKSYAYTLVYIMTPCIYLIVKKNKSETR
jgi:hypothetical protein